MDRSYKVELRIGFDLPRLTLEQRAIEILNKRRRPRRPSIEAANVFPGLGRTNEESDLKGLKGTPSIAGMKQWLHELGYSVLVGLYPFVSRC